MTWARCLTVPVYGSLVAFLFQFVAIEPTFAAKLRIPGKKEQAAVFTPSGLWEAYIHDNEGNSRRLAEPVEQTSDKDWMFLKFTEYKGPKNRIAVMQVENKTSRAPTVNQAIGIFLGQEASEVPLGAIEELITTALVNTNRFDVIERKQIQTVIAEQDFGGSGRVSAETAVKLGKLQGVDYLILSSVNEWSPNKRNSGIGASGGSGGMLGGLGVGRSTAEVAISFRIVDAKTGLVTSSITERATAGSWGLSLKGGAGFGGAAGGLNSKDPISYAVQSCINKASYKVATSLKSQTWRGTIAKVEGEKVYINAGNNRGLAVGTELTCLTKGEEIVDPETGAVLDADTEAIGMLTVTTVKDNLSIATIVQGCKGLKRGDQVEVADGGKS